MSAADALPTPGPELGEHLRVPGAETRPGTVRRVLVAEFMDAAGLGALAARAEVSYLPLLGHDRAALLQAVRGTEALVVRNRCRVDADVLEAAGPSLAVVGRLGAGLDNIDTVACRAAGVQVVFARGANADAVCEYVFAGLLHLLRSLGAADAAVRAGAWPREGYSGGELSGRTLGLLGLGEVGRRMARRAHAFGLPTIGYDPVVGGDSPLLRGVPVTVLGYEDVLTGADILSLHLPLLPATRGLIGREALARMRPGAILVNAARGGIVDEAALAEALRDGRLGGAVLDVREVEPPPQPDPLATAPRALLTPHIAGLTAEAQARVGLMVAEDILAVLAGRPPRSGA